MVYTKLLEIVRGLHRDIRSLTPSNKLTIWRRGSTPFSRLVRVSDFLNKPDMVSRLLFLGRQPRCYLAVLHSTTRQHWQLELQSAVRTQRPQQEVVRTVQSTIWDEYGMAAVAISRGLSANHRKMQGPSTVDPAPRDASPFQSTLLLSVAACRRPLPIFLGVSIIDYWLIFWGFWWSPDFKWSPDVPSIPLRSMLVNCWS